MTTSIVDPSPALPRSQRHQRMEVDTFCAGCGYNLYAQPVTRDERLGIFICRCPECGQFHPAGTGVSAVQPWLHRLGVAMLVLWVLFVLHAVFWSVFAMGLIPVAHTEIFSYRQMVDRSGKPVEEVFNANGSSAWVYKGTRDPAQPWQGVMTTSKQEDYRGRERWDWTVFAVIAGCAAGIGLVPGILLVIFIWHWKRRNYAWAMLLPVTVAAVMSVYFRFDPEYQFVLAWATKIAFGYALLQALFMAIGILIGRPIARGVLRIIVPPRARQIFAFLWRVDGKNPPLAHSS